MEIMEIQEELDSLYETQDLRKVYDFLVDKLYMAMQNDEDGIVLFLLNEMLGYDRVTSNYNEGNQMVLQILKLLQSRGLEKSLSGATSFLNIATLYRAEGLYEEALKYYLEAEKIYQNNLDEKDERYGALYNNVSLLYLEIGEHEKALDYALKALDIMLLLSHCEVEQATSYINIAQIYLSIHKFKESQLYLKKGINLFQTYAPQDPHYFAALSLLANQLYLNHQYQDAITIYEDVLIKIESVYGKNKDYHIVLDNKEKIEKEWKCQKIKGLDLCEEYYHIYGKKMIERQFQDIKKYMAIGLFGFGSECMGYDDEISQDHDFGPGFCILLPQDIFEQWGEDLQKAYDLLPKSFHGYQRVESEHGQGRVGVFEINTFFNQFLYRIPRTMQEWLYTDENALLAVTNGRIFDDYFGEVTRIRNRLSYYPEDIRIKKLVRSIAKMAQSGQYNYARCMKRQQEPAAFLALSEFIDETLSCLYLLNKKYKPYYKWSFYGLKDCVIGKNIQPLLEQLIHLPCQKQYWTNDSPSINRNDQKVVLIEKICQLILKELQKQGLTSLDDEFLDNHTLEMMNHIHDQTIRQKHIMEG